MDTKNKEIPENVLKICEKADEKIGEIVMSSIMMTGFELLTENLDDQFCAVTYSLIMSNYFESLSQIMRESIPKEALDNYPPEIKEYLRDRQQQQLDKFARINKGK